MDIATLAILVIIVPTMVSVLGVFAAHRLLRGKIRHGHNEIITPIFATVGTIYAVMLAFLVIVVWEAHGEAESNVTREAATLTTLYRMTNGMPEEQRLFMRSRIRGYTNAVIHREWRIQAENAGRDVEARRKIGEIFAEFGRMPSDVANSTISREFLRQFATVTEARNQRAGQAASEVPWLLWLGLISGGVVVMGMCFMLSVEAIWTHAIVSGALGFVVGLLLFTIVLLSSPFKGPLGISPGSFEQALNIYAGVDRGT